MPRLVVRLGPLLNCWVSIDGFWLFYWVGGKKIVTKQKRWYKDVGLGFKTPSEAINGTYIGASQTSLYLRPWLIIKFRQEVPFCW